MMALQHKITPGMVQATMAVQVDKTHLSRHHGAENWTGNLYQPSEEGWSGSVEGGWHGRRRTAQRRALTALSIAGGAVLIGRLIR